MKIMKVARCQNRKVSFTLVLNFDEVIQTILDLGNQVLANLGVEEPIEDVAVFFSDQFYI